MSKLPKDDQKLVDFIHQYRPEVPPGSEDLEARIMAALEAKHPSEAMQKSSVIPLRRRRLWLMPPAIAAGLLISWGTHHWLTPAPPTETEIASLEVFIETTWDEVVEPDYLYEDLDF
jgi:hypothetical protein